MQERDTYFSTQLVEQKALRKTGFHSDILRPLDIEHTLGGVPENSYLGRSFVGVYHSGRAGHFTEAQKQAYGLLMPHIQRALVWRDRRLHPVVRYYSRGDNPCPIRVQQRLGSSRQCSGG